MLLCTVSCTVSCIALVLEATNCTGRSSSGSASESSGRVGAVCRLLWAPLGSTSPLPGKIELLHDRDDDDNDDDNDDGDDDDDDVGVDDDYEYLDDQHQLGSTYPLTGKIELLHDRDDDDNSRTRTL